jgi:hypothetical protein
LTPSLFIRGTLIQNSQKSSKCLSTFTDYSPIKHGGDKSDHVPNQTAPGINQNIMENNLTVINKSDPRIFPCCRAFKREIAGRQTERLSTLLQLDISLTVLQTGRLPCRIALTTRVLAVSFLPLSYPNLPLFLSRPWS